jgi:4-amino-4-deoxy-L-arabinose transferase-like glycosyltransferase
VGKAPGIATANAVVVIPTFNERHNIAKLVETLFRLYPEIHVLVVDDRSPDGTADVVRELQQRYANLMLLERMQNPGFGPSYRDGFRHVLAEPWCQAVVTMDADFSHDPAEIARLLEQLADHDMVVGSRYAAGGSVQRWKLWRRILSRGANFYVHAVLGLAVRDTTSGFQCMRREALERVLGEGPASDGYAFLVELKYRFGRLGLRMAEHPIVFEERREGESKMSAGKVWESVWLPWRIRFGRGPGERSSELGTVLLCVALFLLTVAAAWPVLEMGINDDWSYTHIARDFAATGQLAYNGWTAVILIPQIVWAAAFIKLFGFSFLVVRLSTVAMAVFLIPVLYCIARESGLTRVFARFATLLVVLSPLFVPVAASYMSDVPSFFFFALCLYGGIRCWKAVTSRSCVAWAWLVALAGVLSGLDRQIYWPAPLLFLPAIAWVRRRKKGAAVHLGIAWLAAIAAIAISILWFQAKPYILIEHTLDKWAESDLGFLAVRERSLLRNLAMTAALILSPLLAGYVRPGLRAMSRNATAVMLAVALSGGLGLSALGHPMPSMGNVLTQFGIIGQGIAPGEPTLVLGPTFRMLLTIGVFFCCACCGMTLWPWRREAARVWNDPVIPVAVLGLAFGAVWLPVVLYRSVGMDAFDRYLIPFMPVLGIPLLRFYQTHIGTKVSRWSGAMLVLFALYGVATTHDSFSSARARLAAAQRLEQAGIPRTEITAGFEYDGWTQLEAAGYVNNKQIENPMDAYSPLDCSGPAGVRLWFAWLTPAIHPRYFLVLTRLPALEDVPVAPVSYSLLLPFTKRQVFTQIVPGGGQAECR